VGLVAVGGLATQALAAAHAAPQGEVAFTKDIAPILQRSCENCHRQNGVAPMPLSTYEEVQMRPAHAAGVLEMRKGALDPLPASPHRSSLACTSYSPTIAMHRGLGSGCFDQSRRPRSGLAM
jgi:hypothetical protein